MFKQIKNLGTEKTTPENTDLIPIQQLDGATRRISRGNFLQRTYIQLIGSQTSGTAGGSASTGNWFARKLNIIKNDDTALVTLNSNSFVLPSGAYIINVASSFYGCQYVKLRLQNMTDSTTVLLGLTNYSNGSADTVSTLSGKFIIPANKNLQLQYRASAPGSTNALGLSAGFGVDEISTFLDLLKI